jgi:hypothetical protein
MPDALPQERWSDGRVNDLANVPEPAIRMRLTKEKNGWLGTVRPDGSVSTVELVRGKGKRLPPSYNCPRRMR